MFARAVTGTRGSWRRTHFPSILIAICTSGSRAADVCSSNFTHGTRRTIPTLSIPMQRPPVHGVVLWFQVADFDAAMDRVRELAAVIIYGPFVNPALRHREVWLRDPDH